MISQAQYGRLISHSANLLYLLGKRARQFVLGPKVMKKELAIEQRNKTIRSIELLSQYARLRVVLTHIGRRNTFGGGQCWPERNPHIQFLLLLPEVGRQTRQQI